MHNTKQIQYIQMDKECYESMENLVNKNTSSDS